MSIHNDMTRAAVRRTTRSFSSSSEETSTLSEDAAVAEITEETTTEPTKKKKTTRKKKVAVSTEAEEEVEGAEETIDKEANATKKKKKKAPRKKSVVAIQDGEDTETTDKSTETSAETTPTTQKAKKAKAKKTKKATNEIEAVQLPPPNPIPPPVKEFSSIKTVVYCGDLEDPIAAPHGVTVVQNVNSAKEIFSKLMELKDAVHACDTEVVDIDLKQEGPVGHGKVICFSIYCGPEYDFGNGPKIWVDTMRSPEVLEVFKEYFESPEISKVWHNYSFDYHVLANHDIVCQGFGGDTLHMARLLDASRLTSGGYSLEALSEHYLGSDYKKTSMDDIFGRPKIKKDGTPGKIKEIPPLEDIQADPSTALDWIDYSTKDTAVTWLLRNFLQRKLKEFPMNQNGEIQTLWDFYQFRWLPFGQMLVDMERWGVKVDTQYLASLEPKATADSQEAREVFIDWAKTKFEDAIYMNPGSDKQLQVFLFGGCIGSDGEILVPLEKTFKIENTAGFIQEGKTKALAKREITVKSLNVSVRSYTDSGLPSVDTQVMKDLAGEPSEGRYGYMYSELGGGEEGKAGCEAIDALIRMNSIETLKNTFIIPLQHVVDANGRVHASINLNTETGRLSCRKPNLQNQPALEKDRYKIRRAFTCEEGNLMIAADYGQLELRLLAHITKCQSMIDAFKLGGDFHSRTAMGMYEYVKKAVDDGDVLLEWDTKRNGAAPKPLLKDVFAVERRRAKVLNFSIAYGKTVHGLAKDWQVSNAEAKDILDRWYSDRPEVKQWQQATIQQARRSGYTRTLGGRYRRLPDINDRSAAKRSHSERAAINTPLQGGAADVVMYAMLKIHENQRFREIGWRTVLQIHDELLFEGPKETVDEAYQLVITSMRDPANKKLLVDLVVDAKIGNNWWECK